MSRKDYELIAQVISGLKNRVVDDMALNAIVSNFIEELEDDNPRFDAQRFAKACGLWQLFILVIVRMVASNAKQIVVVSCVMKTTKAPIVLTRRGERLLLAVSWLAVVALISFADVLAGLLN